MSGLITIEGGAAYPWADLHRAPRFTRGALVITTSRTDVLGPSTAARLSPVRFYRYGHSDPRLRPVVPESGAR